MSNLIPNLNSSQDAHLLPSAFNTGLRTASGTLSTDVQADGQSDEFNIDLMGLWHILLKRRWTIAATVGIVFVLVLVASLLMTPVYRATATLQIDREQVSITKDSAPVMTFNDPSYIQTQFQVLQSRELAERVLNDMGYQDEKHFSLVFPPSSTHIIRQWFGQQKKLDETQLKSAAIARVNTFKKDFTIEPIRQTRLVKINYDSINPVFAIDSVNSLSEAFINRNLEARFDAANYAKSYLEDQLKQLKLKLEDSEAQLVKFATKEQIVSSGGDDGSLPEQNLGALNAALAKAKEERIHAQSTWNQAQNSVGMVTFGDFGENSIIHTLEEDRSKLMADYQDKSSLYKPAYPVMVQLKSQIAELDKQIAYEVENIKSAIRADYEVAQQNENMIAAQIKALKGEALDLQSRSIQYNIYKREVDTNRQIYDAMLQRYKEIGVAAGVGNNNIAVVDRAVNANKTRPNTPLNLAIALFLGLVLSLIHI
jgi:succinoglycan biosynthesis transport protein ExoP